MSEQPAIGGKAPIPVQVAAGEEYWWCACGRSANQPFCDGSATMPLCDGSHNKLAASV